MKNLKINARITEVADTATRLLILFKRHPTIGDDTILKPLFAEIGTLAEQLSEVIKSDKTISELDIADTVRGEAIRKFDKILQGYAAMPIETLQKPGAKLYEVFSKYGVKITRENYAVESAHIDSLLTDRAAPGLAGEISSLAGVTEAIEAIRTAQKSFNEKRVTYEQNIAAKNAKQKSAELKKMLLERVNTSLLPYLTSLKSMKSAGYSDFIEGVSQIIANTNSSISARRKKTNNDDTPAKKDGE